MTTQKTTAKLNTVFQIFIILIIAIPAFYCLNYFGIVDFSSALNLRVPVIDLAVSLQPKCFDKEIGGTYKISIQKNSSEDTFLKGLKTTNVYEMTLHKSDCTLEGTGHQTHVSITSTNEEKGFKKQGNPAIISGRFSNDSIIFNFRTKIQKTITDSYHIVCKEPKRKLDSFEGKIFDTDGFPVGLAFFEKMNLKPKNDTPIENNEENLNVKPSKVSQNVKNNEDIRLNEEESIISIEEESIKEEFKFDNLEINEFYYVRDWKLVEVDNFYSIQVAAKSFAFELNLFLEEYEELNDFGLMLAKTNEEKNAYKFLVGHFAKKREAISFKKTLQSNFGYLGEVKTAWIISSNDLKNK